jgi:hypothetical protein
VGTGVVGSPGVPVDPPEPGASGLPVAPPVTGAIAPGVAPAPPLAAAGPSESEAPHPTVPKEAPKARATTKLLVTRLIMFESPSTTTVQRR